MPSKLANGDVSLVAACCCIFVVNPVGAAARSQSGQRPAEDPTSPHTVWKFRPMFGALHSRGPELCEVGAPPSTTNNKAEVVCNTAEDRKVIRERSRKVTVLLRIIPINRLQPGFSPRVLMQIMTD